MTWWWAPVVCLEGFPYLGLHSKKETNIEGKKRKILTRAPKIETLGNEVRQKKLKGGVLNRGGEGSNHNKHLKGVRKRWSKGTHVEKRGEKGKVTKSTSH